jgi:hypothetical protein
MRATFGGFVAKAHYQKWYKRAFFAIFNMMTLNALVAWNLSAKMPRLNRPVLKRHEFFWYIAQYMLDYKEEHSATSATTTAASSTITAEIIDNIEL